MRDRTLPACALVLRHPRYDPSQSPYILCLCIMTRHEVISYNSIACPCADLSYHAIPQPVILNIDLLHLSLRSIAHHAILY